MSAEATSWVKRQKIGNPTRKAILRALADYAGPSKADRDAPPEAHGRHFCFAGIELIADETDCSTRTVKRHLSALVDSGHVLRVRRMRGFIRTSDYTILACDADGPRPFTAEEQLFAAGLAPEGDILSPANPEPLTCEGDILSPSEGDSLTPTGTGQIVHPKGPLVSPSEGATRVPCVPYVGTTSNYEPQQIEPAPHERDFDSPAVLIPSGDDVLSRHTLNPVAASFGREMRKQTEEIMAGWQGWIGTKLPAGVVVEVSRAVKHAVGDGVEIDAIKLGLKDWTERGMQAPKFRLPELIAARATDRLRRDPSKAQQKHERSREIVKNAAAALGGRVIGKADVEALLQRASGLGVAADQPAIGGAR